MKALESRIEKNTNINFSHPFLYWEKKLNLIAWNQIILMLTLADSQNKIVLEGIGGLIFFV